MFAIMTSTIKKGIDDGSLRADIEPEKFALLLASISNGFYQFIEENGKSFISKSIVSENEFLSMGLKLISTAIQPGDGKNVKK
jgi:hypothetical protein